MKVKKIDVIDVLSCINGEKMSISNSFLHRRLIDAVLQVGMKKVLGIICYTLRAKSLYSSAF